MCRCCYYPWRSRFQAFCFAEAAANLLTNAALDPYGKIPEFKFCAARVVPAGNEQMAAAE